MYHKTKTFLIKNIKHYNLKFVFTILVFNIYNYAFAQTPITIQDALNIAMQNNGTLKADGLEVNATKALLKTANELPKLNFNAQLGQYNSIKFDNAFQISQNIPFPTLFGAKKQLINEQVKEKELQQQISTNELKSQVRTYFYQIQYLQHNQAVLQHLDSLYLEFIRVATLRYKTGDIKKIEINTAETQKGEINLLFQQNKAYLQNAYQQFYTLLNSKENVQVINTAQYEPLQIATLIPDTAALGKHPNVQALYQQIKIAEQNKKVEKAQGLPDFTVGYNNQSLIGFQNIDNQDKYFGAGSRFNSINVGVSIPLTYSATKARIKAIQYQQQALEATALQQQKMLTTELQNAINQYNQAIQQYQYYKNQALPNATDIIKAAQLGYKTGEIGYVEYLYALQTTTEVQLKYLQAIQQINSTVITINSLINQ